MPWYLWALLVTGWAAPLVALAVLFWNCWMAPEDPREAPEVDWQPGMMVQRTNPRRNGR